MIKGKDKWIFEKAGLDVEEASSWKVMILYAFTVFVSAFLLFLVQPLLARYILPWFGGSPGVWTTCLLFFQVLLLAGYGFAHYLAGRFSHRRQAVIFLMILLLTIALLPIAPSSNWDSGSQTTPTWDILRILLLSIGACYFLLASTSPLMQAWFSLTGSGASPYRLYAFSNLGSLIAVAGYPFIIEPNLGLSLQSKIWSYLYVVFVAACCTCAFKLWDYRKSERIPPSLKSGEDPDCPERRPAGTEKMIWLSLAALSSANLIATTNQLCLDVAVIPLLWLLPMGIYLLSFILCFHSDKLYSRPCFGIALAIALAQTCVILNQGVFVGLEIQIVSYSFTLFVCCMICHGELVRLKPGSGYLTSFYLMISTGGALGGVFVTLIAPHIFKGYWEFHLALAGTALMFLIVLFRDRKCRLFGGRPLWLWACLYLSFVVLVMALGYQIRDSLKDTIATKRNFFGILRVLEHGENHPEELRRVLMHGRIEHGFQFAAEDKKYWPTSYFGPNSGVGIAIQFHPRRLNPAQRHLRIGVVGLGTATLAAYGESGDYFRFYEINPDVVEFSNKYFTYQKDSPAMIDIVLGDARISMEKERSQRRSGRFDVLAIDAFSSDAIPVHLLTRECYEIYRHHLKTDGILAVHISSRYFDLSPVVRSLAQLDAAAGVQAVLIADEGSTMQGTDATCWVLVTSNEEFLVQNQVHLARSPWPEEDPPPLLFTDDYSNLFRLLKKRQN